MIQEYLFVGTVHREAVNALTHKSVHKEINDIENTDCWIITFMMEGENEKSANILSTIHDQVVERFNPTILTNGCSAYYNKALFPQFNEFERKLRKLLYLKSALSKEKKDSETIKDLESKDLGEIFTLMFTDTQFVQNAKKCVNGKTWQFTKTEILTDLQQLSENTLWDKLLGPKAVSALRTDYVKVKNFRNDVMHAHSMSSSTYSKAMKLIKRINEQLDMEIGKIIVEKEEMTEAPVGENFNTAINAAIKALDESKIDKTLLEQLEEINATFLPVKRAGLLAGLEEYKELLLPTELGPFEKYVKSNELEAIQLQIGEIAKIQEDFPLALQELKDITATIDDYKLDVPPTLLELQKSLQDYKPDPTISKLLEKLKNEDFIDGKGAYGIR